MIRVSFVGKSKDELLREGIISVDDNVVLT